MLFNRRQVLFDSVLLPLACRGFVRMLAGKCSLPQRVARKELHALLACSRKKGGTY